MTYKLYNLFDNPQLYDDMPIWLSEIDSGECDLFYTRSIAPASYEKPHVVAAFDTEEFGENAIAILWSKMAVGPGWDEFYSFSIQVDPFYQDLGIGTQLITEAVKYWDQHYDELGWDFKPAIINPDCGRIVDRVLLQLGLFNDAYPFKEVA